MYLSSWDFPYKHICDKIRFVELSDRKKKWNSSYLEDDAHVTFMLLHTFPICSSVLTCANSCKNTLSAKEIVEAQWYSRILNLYTCIPYCLFLTLYTLTSIYMHILHTFLCVLTRRICSTIKSFFLLVIISSILMTFMFNLGMMVQGEISS